MKKWKGVSFFIDRRAIRMLCAGDIKNRIINPKGNGSHHVGVSTLPFLSENGYLGWEAFDRTNDHPQHTTHLLLVPDEQVPAWDARDALGYILDCTLKDLVTRPGPLFRCDPIWRCYRPDRHVSDTTEWVVIETESVPTAATRPDDGKSIAQEETPIPDPLPKGVGADGAGSSLPPSLFVPTWGIHQRSRVTTPEECRDLMVNLIPPGVREEMNLLDNNVVLDRAWFSLARGAMAQAHALCQFESLYDTHHALQESHETMRGQLVRTREEFNAIQNFYNTLSGRHRQLREEHAQCSEGLAVVQAEKDSLMATNAEQALRIKELEQKLKSVDEVHSSAVKDLESQLAQKDSALVYAERISGERLSENEGLRAQLAFAQKEKTDAIRKLLPTVV
ncbi:hypothetical protein Tco_0647774 [Tanacetum coccineum]